MKRLLPFLLLFVCAQAEAKIQIKPFDSIGVKNISRDITAQECATNAIPKFDGSKWQCATDSTGAGGAGVVEDYLVDLSAGSGVSVDTTEISHDQTWSNGTLGETRWNFNLATGGASITFKNARTNISGDWSVSSDLFVLGDDITGGTNTSRFVWMADGTNYSPEAIDLGFDTAGNFAAGDAEFGAATSGDSATSFFPTGTLEVVRGGTGVGTVSDDSVLVGNSAATGYDQPALPSCSNTVTSKLLYNSSTNNFSCGTDQSAAGGSGSMTTVKTDDSQVGDADIVTLDFGLGLDVTESPNTEQNISIDATEVPANRTTAGFIQPQSMVSIDILVSVSHDPVTVTGENYLSLSGQQITAGTVNDTNLTAEDFGDFTCDSNEDGCNLDADVVSNDELAPQAVSTDQLEASNKPTEGMLYAYNASTLKGQWRSCATITGSSALCDGNDASGAGGSSTFSWTPEIFSAKLPSVGMAQIDAGKPGWRLLFDATLGERVSFDTVLAPYSGGAVSMDVKYTMTSATTGGIALGVFVECITPGDATIVDDGSYDTVNTSIQTVPGTAGTLAQVGIPLGSFDSCTEKDKFRFLISRDVVSTDDTATGDLEIREIRIYES